MRTSSPPRDLSLFRRPRFWLVQVAGWLLIQLLFLGQGAVNAIEDGAPVSEVVLVFLFSVALSIACSTALSWAYLRIPEPWLTGGKTIPLLLGLSILASAPWTAGMYTAFRLTDWQANETLDWVPFFFTFRCSVMLAAWSSLFLLTMLGERVQRQRERVLTSVALAHEAQLQSLRAQLNPHFLFNAMNSVVALIDLEPAKARQMVRDVAALLRRALASTQAEGTTLGEELDFVLQYLRCESARFDERLQVEVDVPDALHGLPVPSMLLQPLVENAIKHGMQGGRGVGLVLRGRAQDGRLQLEVRNTGSLRIPEIRKGVDGRARSSSGPGENGTGKAQPAGDRAAAGGAGEARGGSAGAGLRIVCERLMARHPKSASFELVAESGWVVARLAYEPAEHPAQARLARTEANVMWS